MSAPYNAPVDVQPVRRSVTLPTKLTPRNQPKSDSPEASDTILFYHPSVRVVHFAPRSVVPVQLNAAPSDFDYPVDTIETLPWRSATERTVACGPLRIEQIPGLTAFLKCGNVVHAILKNSQCWCVDGVSIFVLRIRPLTYYRIELPNESEEDKQRASDLKIALPRILRYEITPCPFKRGFTVEIPLEAILPRRKKAWRPRSRDSAPPTPSDASQVSQDSWLSDQASTGYDTDRDATDFSVSTANKSTADSTTEVESVAEDDKSVPALEIPVKNTSVHCSVAEPQPKVNTLLAKFEAIPESDSEAEQSNLSTSSDSFHSVQTPVSPLPPSPPYSDTASPPPAFNFEKKLPILSRRHSGEISEIKVNQEQVSSATQTTPHLSNVAVTSLVTQTSPAHSTFSGVSAASTAVHVPAKSCDPAPSASRDVASSAPSSTSTGVEIEDRTLRVLSEVRASRKRDLSPMPPPSILFQPTAADSGHHLTASILQKTCSIVLVPPFQLLVLLIQVAARIAVGTTPDSALHDAKDGNTLDLDGQDEEDDFGLPITPALSRQASRSSQGKDVSELD
ncbi:conserved hypothetical protein [Paecilomyces variotii No. 5]|uniref:Inheritance of peroxisomes protein 1 n=1 Tax=Byssochlamys spectabilis (strain No. 5 / NBRC 109023) TaxID=1356009 RepID=V5FLG4_BYSSN|nr:conserved hypothetical protein [Paecilomyces variotii No. 5]